ncbi:MAG: hypothetical protein WA666_02615 [Nitrospirota bacterium]
MDAYYPQSGSLLHADQQHWQLNGPVRQYFPKGHDFKNITDEQINFVMDRLNNRPRKSLGFLTPMQVFYNLKPVALET